MFSNSSCPSTTVNPPVITSPLDGATITANTVTIEGTATIGDTVEIFDETTPLGTVPATDGTWSFTTGTLTEANHTFTATATNGFGTSNVSNSVMITVDTISLPPVITNPVDGFTSLISDVTFSGTAEINSTVEIFDGVNPTWYYTCRWKR